VSAVLLIVGFIVAIMAWRSKRKDSSNGNNHSPTATTDLCSDCATTVGGVTNTDVGFTETTMQDSWIPSVLPSMDTRGDSDVLGRFRISVSSPK
jgi:hypothetical protein